MSELINVFYVINFHLFNTEHGTMNSFDSLQPKSNLFHIPRISTNKQLIIARFASVCHVQAMKGQHARSNGESNVFAFAGF